MDIDELKTAIKVQNKKYQRKKAENRRLKATIESLLKDVDSSSGAEASTLGVDDSEYDEEDELVDDCGGGRVNIITLPTPIWSDSENTFFCTACTWEVVDGECCKCGLKHAWKETPEMIQDAIDNANCIIHPDRDLHPRGTTPLRELTADELGDVPPKGCTPELYWALLQRGVSDSMCWNYRMKYTYEGGIWVEFDSSSRLYKEMLHPSFHNGLKWRVYLGRQLQLAEDDPDGSLFIENLIEEAMFFPYRNTKSGRTYEAWETVMKSGVWLTRPMGSASQEENEWLSDQDEEFEEKDSDVTWDKIAEMENEALENGVSLLPTPFMNDYLPELDYESSAAESDEADELHEDVERVNLNEQPSEAAISQASGAIQQASEAETESSDEEVDELEDEAALHLFPDTACDSSFEDEEDTTSDCTTTDSENADDSETD